jgi:hypothetical protein
MFPQYLLTEVIDFDLKFDIEPRKRKRQIEHANAAKEASCCKLLHTMGILKL